MNFAIAAVSVLAAVAVGCAGKSSSTSAGTVGGEAGNGVLLYQTTGWVDGASNSLGIQGAVFDVGDPASQVDLALDVTHDGKACIKGIAAKIDSFCTLQQGSTDCFTTYFGAYLGENLNQMGDLHMSDLGSPMPFDASGLKGFSFDVEGPTVPVKGSFRFNAQDATGTNYGSPPATAIGKGSNTMLFTHLFKDPFHAAGPSADSAKAALTRISWQVVSNQTGAVPFDFCVSNVRALPE
jgi:hypothetical protein